MAGYSGTPLLKKLGIQEGHRVHLRHAPMDLPDELKGYSNARAGKDLDVVVLFAKSLAVFQDEFAALMNTIKAEGMIWVAWPKKSSGLKTDVTEDAIREQVLKTDFVDVKICAIDDTWSGLKFVIRKEHRPAMVRQQNKK